MKVKVPAKKQPEAAAEKTAKTEAKASVASAVSGLSLVTFINPEHIFPHEELPNRPTNPEWVKELAKDIRQNGLDTPLFTWDGGDPSTEVEVELNGKKERLPANFLVAGGHRHEALLALLTEEASWFAKKFPQGIPVIRRTGPIEEMIAVQLRENVQRRDMPAHEVLPLVKRLKEQHNWKLSAIAKKIGKSVAWVSEVFDVEKKLGKEATEEIQKGGVTLGAAVRAKKKVAAGTATPQEALEEAKKETKEKKESGRTRADRKVGIKKIWIAYKALPKRNIGAKLELLEGAFAYLTGESEELPEDLQPDDTEE